MPWIRRLSSTTTFVTVLATTAALASVAGWNLHRASRQASEAADWVDHSHEVLRALSEFREGFVAIAAGQRGYLATGAPAFVEERDQAIARTEAALLRVQVLVSDNAAQRDRTFRLQAALTQRKEAAEDLARWRGRNRTGMAWPAEYEQRSAAAAREVLGLAHAMEQEESRLLAERQAMDAERKRSQGLLVLAFCGVFGTVLVLSYAALFVESRRRRRSERQMSEILEDLPVTVWQMVSGPGKPPRFVYVGSNAARERGAEVQELLADPGFAMRNVLEEDQPRMVEALAAAESSLQPLDCSYRVALPARGVRWLHKHARLRRRADGSTLWTGYWADITEQKTLEQALREATVAAESANRAKTTFLATMSHEIRTPLNGVMGLLELLSLTQLEGEQRATLGVVRESGRSLLRIIDDILDFSKVEAGRLELKPVAACLRDTIERACQVHSGVASSRGLLLEHTIDPRISPALLFDPLRLGQILNNLISNALKFTREGSVRVAAELLAREGGREHVLLTVTDTGIGVPPEAVQRLFQPFVQMEQATQTFGGTGLGLAISRRLAELMGATVQMHSTPGQGTQMRMELRLEAADPEAVQDLASEAVQRRLTHAVAGRRFAPSPQEAEEEGTLVLVVDDHPTNRLVLARQVAALGYGAVTAEDGEQALAVCRTRRIALVLTDCHMPRLDGYEFARSIRAEEARTAAGRVPIIGCTANAMNTEAARCVAAGMDDCLIKPVDLLELLRLFDQWLPLPDGSAAHGGQGLLAAVFDPAMLVLITGGDAAAERPILQEFLGANAADLAALDQALADADFAQARGLVHRIAGAAQTLGASGLLAACRSLEESAGQGDHAAARADAAELQAQAALLEAVLAARMAAAISPA